jgi:tRNA 2-thiocytidine biosynthesis protein TtcA
MTPKKFHRRLHKQIGKAIGDFNLIEEGDRIAVGVSGGKDSYTLLHLLEEFRRKAPVRFQLVALNIDAGFPGYRKEILEAHLQQHGFTYRMQTTNSYRIIEEHRRPGSSYCSFCARLRRGVLYRQAGRLGCNKIALGHHLDDFIETLLLNQFYVGTLAAMSPKLLADNGEQTVIRPLVYVEESDIIQYSRLQAFPIICCACPVCGIQDQKRQKMKQLIRLLAKDIPQIRRSLLGALGNIRTSHLLDGELRFD